MTFKSETLLETEAAINAYFDSVFPPSPCLCRTCESLAVVIARNSELPPFLIFYCRDRQRSFTINPGGVS